MTATSPPAPLAPVQAAGGVPWRASAGQIEVVLVHRPRYDDWSLPKGKRQPGEHALVAAVREVAEETGLRCTPEVRLPDVQYLTGVPGITKFVRYWSMRVRADHGHRPDAEVDEVRWVEVAAAQRLVSYAHDRGVLAAFAALPVVDRVVLLVRHAAAGSRRQWDDPDRLRPLDRSGQAQAAALAALLLAVFAPGSVVSASPRRCQQTVAELGLPVRVEPAFDEPESPAATPLDIRPARAKLLDLANQPDPLVVCSQGGVISQLLTALAPLGTGRGNEFETAKGSGWLLGFAGDQAVGADPVVPSPPGAVAG